MSADHSIIAMLADPLGKAFFLSLLESSLSAEEKYQRLLEFLQPDGELPEFLLEMSLLSAQATSGNGPAALAHGKQPLEIQAQLLDGLQRALRRLSASQHQDGGWGPYVETSTFWDTASAVLFLTAARQHPLLSGVIDDLLVLRRACVYLEHHPEDWSADTLAAGDTGLTHPTPVPVIPNLENGAGSAGGTDGTGSLPAPRDSLSIYNLCLMVRVFFHGGREFLRRETAVRVYRSLEHLLRAQNDDGGWDACLWSYAVTNPTRIFSEVGATAAALCALVEVDDERLSPAACRAAHWLVSAQNMDGSWNSGACRPDLPPFTLTGDPRVSKTCDALCSLLSSPFINPAVEPYCGVLRRGLAWLLRRTRPVLEKHLHPAAWMWGYTAGDYEDITQVLEALLCVPAAPMPLLEDYAGWLLQGQHRLSGDVEDGRWVLGDTARISQALMSLYGLVA